MANFPKIPELPQLPTPIQRYLAEPELKLLLSETKDKRNQANNISKEIKKLDGKDDKLSKKLKGKLEKEFDKVEKEFDESLDEINKVLKSKLRDAKLSKDKSKKDIFKNTAGVTLATMMIGVSPELVIAYALVTYAYSKWKSPEKIRGVRNFNNLFKKFQKSLDAGKDKTKDINNEKKKDTKSTIYKNEAPNNKAKDKAVVAIQKPKKPYMTIGIDGLQNKFKENKHKMNEMSKSINTLSIDFEHSSKLLAKLESKGSVKSEKTEKIKSRVEQTNENIKSQQKSLNRLKRDNKLLNEAAKKRGLSLKKSPEVSKKLSQKALVIRTEEIKKSGLPMSERRRLNPKQNKDKRAPEVAASRYKLTHGKDLGKSMKREGARS